MAGRFKYGRRAKGPFKKILNCLVQPSCWMLALLIHAGLILVMGIVTFVDQAVSGSAIITMSVSDRKPRLPADDIKPFGKPDDAALDDSLFMKAPILDRNEVAGINGAFPVFEVDTISPAEGILGNRTGTGRLNGVVRHGGSLGSERAVERGLDWLKRHQNKDGSWSRQCSAHCAKGKPCAMMPVDASTCRTGLTGLATLAFLGAGYTHTGGKHAPTVAAALEFLKKQCRADGVFANDIRSLPGLDLRYYELYEQAIAAWALCEAYTMSKDEKLKKPAESALDCLYSRVGRIEWGPRMLGSMDTSAMGFIVMCLKSAEAGGFATDRKALSFAEKWFVEATRDGGQADYIPGHYFKAGTFSMTAISAYSREILGTRQDDALLGKQMAILLAEARRQKGPGFSNDLSPYSAYYGTLAAFHFGGDIWPAWNRVIRDMIVQTQQVEGCAAGSWYCNGWGIEAYVPRIFTTCLEILTLEVYYRYLPLYQTNDGPGATNEDVPKDSLLHGILLHVKACDKVKEYATEKADAKADPARIRRLRNESVSASREFLKWPRPAKGMSKEDSATFDEWSDLAITNLMWLYAEGGETDKLVDLVNEFRKSMEGKLGSSAAQIRAYSAAALKLAAELDEQGKKEEAEKRRHEGLEELLLLLQISPGEPLSLYVIAGDLLVGEGRTYEAMDVYASADARYGNTSADRRELEHIRLQRALCLAETGNHEAAAQVLEKVGDGGKSEMKKMARFFIARGDRFFRDERDFRKACTDFRFAKYLLERDAGDAENAKAASLTRMKVGLCCVELERWDEAVSILEGFRKEHPRAYSGAGKANEAIVIYNLLNGILDENTPAWWAAKADCAECLLKAGRFGDALVLAQVLELNWPDLGGEPYRSRILGVRNTCKKNAVDIGK
jgi:tetratricopeptide (TPR) repeat protein